MPFFMVVVKNRKIKFRGEGLQDALLYIKDRAGNIVFEVSDMDRRKEVEVGLNPGKYSYVIRGDNITYKGSVVVLS